MIKEEDEPLAVSARKLIAAYEIGQALDDLSLEELSTRIEILHREIERLEQARQAKEASRAVAAALFKI
ncbi:MAG: DUF1192 family protein [Beijerinckiaceae bacterium]